MEAPLCLVRSVLDDLTAAGILSEICSDHREKIAYQPACDIDRLTVAGVMDRLDQQGITSIPMADSTEFTKLRETVKRFSEMIEQSPANLKLQDL